MTVEVLLDTGPLVALLDARDRHHGWAVEAFASVPATLTTCEAVLAESCLLLQRWPVAIDAIFRRVVQGTLRIESLTPDLAAVHAIMRKYRDTPASYADACLVRLSEKHARATVLTLDSDFAIYRRNGRQPIALACPV